MVGEIPFLANAYREWYSYFLITTFPAELFLYESPDDSFFPKSGGSSFLKTVGSHFSEIGQSGSSCRSCSSLSRAST